MTLKNKAAISFFAFTLMAVSTKLWAQLNWGVTVTNGTGELIKCKPLVKDSPAGPDCRLPPFTPVSIDNNGIRYINTFLIECAATDAQIACTNEKKDKQECIPTVDTSTLQINEGSYRQYPCKQKLDF